ncbi:hypothetical protein NDU88_001498 [Pleurodeles waltl]|uniref:Uncharacterized protein n=1 Tax=Pleurodeles waltl TaxID=8319 RepID=A0AAV7L9P7_PLEWA|nr:hypothetical protein NDU88_001498 [Pleurodeles waltl]
MTLRGNTMEGPSDLSPGDPTEAPRTIHALPAYQHADLPDTTTFSELPAVSFADNDGEDWPTSPDVSELQAFSSENVTDAEEELPTAKCIYELQATASAKNETSDGEDLPDTTTFSELQAVSFADNDGEELAKANKVSKLQAVPYAEGVTDDREKWPTSPDVSELQAFSSENVTDAEEVTTLAEMPVIQLSSSDPVENLISSEETSIENAESEKRVEIENNFIYIGSEDTDTVEEQEGLSTEHGISAVKLTTRILHYASQSASTPGLLNTKIYKRNLNEQGTGTGLFTLVLFPG